MRVTKKLPFLWMIFYFIVMDEVCNNSIISIFESNGYSFALICTFLCVQIFAAPIQAGFSDFYCRKKSLVVSLLVSSVSLLFVFTYVSDVNTSWVILLAMIVLKGVFGNTLPIAWAGLADAKMKDFRFSIGFATVGMAGGYLVLVFLQKYLTVSHGTLTAIGLFVIASILCITYLTDIRDKDSPREKNTTIKQDIYLLVTDFLCCKRFRRALLAFMLWELSFYAVFILDVDMHLDEFRWLSLTMIFGWIVGIFILKFSRASDHFMIKCGLNLSIWSLVTLLITRFTFAPVHVILLGCYFAYSIGCGLLVPSLFSIVSQERQTHEQGKIYGLIESSDTLAFLLAAIMGMVYNKYSCQPNAMLLFSFLILLLSVNFYVMFLESKKHIKHSHER